MYGKRTGGNIEIFLGITGIFIIAEILFIGHLVGIAASLYAIGAFASLYYLRRGEIVTTRLYQSLLLIPVFRIFNFSILLIVEDKLLLLIITNSIFLVTITHMLKLQDLVLNDIGLSLDYLRSAHHGVVLGAPLGLIQFGLSQGGLYYEHINIYDIIMILGLVALVEEIIFRGLIQRSASRAFDKWTAITVTSILFGLMHSVLLNAYLIPFWFLASVMIGWVYAETENMWLIVLMHGTIDLTTIVILPIIYPDIQGQIIEVISRSLAQL